MQLSTLEMFLSKALEHRNEYRTGQSENPDVQHFDTIFEN